ncbi:MAG: efflux RND transporter periplasmic adaptor subunit [candidate division Zixibacteria bacterium]
MVKDRKMRFLKIAFILTALVIVAGCLEQETNEIAEAPPVMVVTEKATVDDFSRTIKVGGTLKGDRQARILSKVIGTVIDIPVRTGQAVRKGDMLVKLDRGGVQSQYNQAEAVYLNAEKQFNKMERLFAAGAISESQRDAAETEYKVAKANFESARQAIEIKAPFDGVVVDIPVRAGNEVAQGLPLIEIANVSALRLILDVPTIQVGIIKTGQKVIVSSSQDNMTAMTGTVISVADAADWETRSFEVECRFDEPIKGFAPGVYVIAEVEIEILSNALLVPNDAILYRSGEVSVYAVYSDTARLISVLVLAGGESYSAIEGQIQPDDRVVVLGHKMLTPGAKVQEATQ